jgi:perosamine synthetase
MRVVEHSVGSILGEEEIEAIRRVISSGQSLAWGPERMAFEEDFRTYSQAKHAISVSSCTAALHVCAQVLRLGPGDEVVCTPQSFLSTTLALIARGVRVRFADIDPETLNIAPDTIEAQIGPHTKAIYLVHHGGNPANMDAIRKIATDYNLPVVEDCAHAVGAESKGRKIGGGDLCCFSFHSLKNMTTLGEGGMLTTNNDEWAAEAAALRTMGIMGETVDRGTDHIGPYAKPDSQVFDHAGISWTRDHTRIDEMGTHYRMSAVQAAVGRVQLRKLDSFIAARERVAHRYTEAIADIPGLRPVKIAAGDKSAWHLYTCFVEPDSGVDRDVFSKYLQEERGVQIIMRFWPLHLSAEHRTEGHRFGECPICEKVWFEQQINLPICAAMEDWEIDTVIAGLIDGMRNCQG